MLPDYNVRSENTSVIVGKAGLQPDVLITATDRAPIVIEAEYDPANSVEKEASERLGLIVVDGRKKIETAIALRYPETLKFSDDLDKEIRRLRMAYAILYENGERFPRSGWLQGHSEDIADLVRLVSTPESAVVEASDHLELGIETAAERLNEISELRPRVASEISSLLGMSNVEQSRRMACAIIANAMVFHDRVATMHDGVKPLNLLCGPDVEDSQVEVLASWSHILDEINYWPIFAIARDILSRLNSLDAARIIRISRQTAGRVSATGVNIAHDLTGRIFQRLIADRKYLATFYTLPPSAILLARLSFDKLQGVDWADIESIHKLRVGDFACGTGALLAAAYQQIVARHEYEGGKGELLHKVMMEEVLFGCDVMPSAVHITGATLSGAYPNVAFERSRQYTLAYGRQTSGDVAIGSLELLQSSTARSFVNMSNPAMRTGSVGQETTAEITAEVPDESFDLVIMNPPFTSNTKHYDADVGVVRAAFAAFGAPVEDQEDMSNRLSRLAKDSSYHGHAGLGSIFAELGHRKLKVGGVLALVLSFSAINGASWKKFRKLIDQNYEDVTVVSIAGNGSEMSFSADTGMAECLVIGRKTDAGANSKMRAVSISLKSRPRDFAQSYVVSKSADEIESVRRLEDGPYGGDSINIGDESVAEALDLPISNPETGWGAGRLADASVAQCAYAISNGDMWLPRRRDRRGIPIVRLGTIGRRGVDSQLFTSPEHKGPFRKTKKSATATYPTLWNHAWRKETRIVCEPDWQLSVRKGMERQAASLWETSSRIHVNSEFTFGSQALGIAFTDDVSAGGRVWPNVQFQDERCDYAFALWGNTTLGMLLHWWVATRTQSSKATLKIAQVPLLPTLDLSVLTDDQLDYAEEIFNEFRRLEIRPAYLADVDPNRELLDRSVICDLLGYDIETFKAIRRLSAKWCAEPCVD